MRRGEAGTPLAGEVCAAQRRERRFWPLARGRVGVRQLGAAPERELDPQEMRTAPRRASDTAPFRA
eukprot:9489962-Pyramimonas_sp.AAC.1